LAPLNTFRLKKAKENTLPKIKHGLSIIGDTGVGKSTFILALLGYEFQEKIRHSGYKILKIKGQVKPEHKKLTDADILSSVTHDLSAYHFSYNDLEILLIDTPGFNDTNGEEMDISNQILIEKACESCEAMCYVYLVNISGLTTKKAATILISLAENIASRFAYQT
jgi:predicted GTPase